MMEARTDAAGCAMGLGEWWLSSRDKILKGGLRRNHRMQDFDDNRLLRAQYVLRTACIYKRVVVAHKSKNLRFMLSSASVVALL